MANRFFSYVLTRDFGFAPNPFNGICTLATCKPKIRGAADIGDWILGTSSTKGGKRSYLVYIMKVDEKISFNDYWLTPKYAVKKPIMNGSLKKMYGDNIYYHDGINWIQADSHHSLEDGRPNIDNIKKDTSVDAVLISYEFYYFGKMGLYVPDEILPNIVKKGPGHRCPERRWGEKLLLFISTKCSSKGYYHDPGLFSKFERYDGKS